MSACPLEDGLDISKVCALLVGAAGGAEKRWRCRGLVNVLNGMPLLKLPSAFSVEVRITRVEGVGSRMPG